MNPAGELERQLRAVGTELGAGQKGRLLRLLEELLRWNRRINLTAIEDIREGIEKHLVDSLSLLPHLEGGLRLLDLGSGAGFPGLPLKVALPDLQVTSVDSVGKKISFQRHVVRTLGLEGFEARQQRAERLPEDPDLAEGFDRVVSRAFASLEDFASLALPCLSSGGRILAMKGSGAEEELEAAQGALRRLGLVCTDRTSFRLPVSGAERVILVLQRPSDRNH